MTGDIADRTTDDMAGGMEGRIMAGGIEGGSPAGKARGKLWAFIRLDFKTIQPYVTSVNMLIYAALVVFLSAMSGSPVSGMGVGMIIGTIFASYPFAVCEKSGMDMLYAALGVERRTVVLGRYVFALILDLAAVGGAVALSLAGSAVLRAFGVVPTANATPSPVEMAWALGAMSAFVVIVQSVQMTFYFKLGYAKAKILSMLPFVVVMAGFAGLTYLGESGIRLEEVFAWIIGTGMAPAMCAAVLAAIIVASMRLSLAFYGRRRF